MTANCRSKNIADALRVVGHGWSCMPAVAESPAFAQAQAPQSAGRTCARTAQPPAPCRRSRRRLVRPPNVAVPGNYVIGPDDLLGIVYWRDKEMSTRRARPSGRAHLASVDQRSGCGRPHS